MVPAAGQTQMLTSGGSIELQAATIVWTGVNSASGSVTANATSGNLLIPGAAFSLSSDSLSLNAAAELTVDGTISAAGNVSLIAASGNLGMAAVIQPRAGSSLQTLHIEAGRNLNLLQGTIPNVTTRLSIIAGRELAQSDALLNWAATGSAGELIVSLGGDLAHFDFLERLSR
jgi:hypothetical protein